MKQLAQLPNSGYALTVLNGSEKGVTYQLMSGKVSIGRGAENNIVIQDDPKISRNHAIITINTYSAEISDVSGRNKVLVGQEEVTTRVLRPGDIIQLGGTQFQFKEQAQVPGELDSPRTHNKPASRKKSTHQRSPVFYIILIGVIALFFWLLNSKVAQKEAVKIRTEDDVQTDLNSNRKIIDALEAEKTRAGTNSRQYEEANLNFIKGFRDYRKGQYDRSIESFQACLSLFSTHPQCQRYLRLAEKKFYELIQYHMVLANKYRAQNQFAACRSSYRNAMVMIKNPSDKIYIEAKSGHDTCRALEGDRF